MIVQSPIVASKSRFRQRFNQLVLMLKVFVTKRVQVACRVEECKDKFKNFEEIIGKLESLRNQIDLINDVLTT